jgi:hypothetical protein
MLARRRTDEGGVAATILLFPVFAIVTFMFVQTIAWQRDRQLASAEADRASSAVALYGASSGTAQADATTRLSSAGLHNVVVSIAREAQLTVVEIDGDAPGILVGTSAHVHVRSVTASERFESP